MLNSKNDIVDSPYQLGLGSFDFTPDLKEKYTVRITTPAKVAEIADPFGSLGMRKAGLVVHVPTAVGKQGDPIRLTLRNQGPCRELLLVAQCRGQIVDQRWVDVNRARKNSCSSRLPTRAGMITVTAYEILEARCNRWPSGSFTAAAKRLELGMTLNTQQHQPAQRRRQISTPAMK